MCNIKALALTVQKLLARLKFQRESQNDRQDKNNMPPPPNLRSRGIKKNFSDNMSKQVHIALKITADILSTQLCYIFHPLFC